MFEWLMCFCLASVLQTVEPKPGDAPFVERSQKQFNFYPGGKIQLTAAVPGDVKIIGWQRPSVLLQWERIIYRVPHDKAATLSAQYPVQVRWGQTSSTIRTSGPPEGSVDFEVHLTLYVPRDKTDLAIQIYRGDLAVGSVNGWIEANLTAGSIEASSVSGYFSGVTKSGDIRVGLTGTRWAGHGLTAVTERGQVELRLPREFSAALQIETGNGNFSIDYPEQLVEGESVPLKAAVRKNARSLSATLGAGGSPIRLMTTSGDIRLSAAP